ncbi:cutinase-domain-containing protein [Elsinoe ampelina]|uniref:Cutinase-domain-containing protein n=1 Tax=Elsinoe ampelina TaxID=302913 RepID=A0A6A6GQZ2_9PEZI|nr:cutinase-domain-containing protein [Elsinoe ampelina]
MKTFTVLLAALTASATAQLFPPSPSGCPVAPDVDTANGVPIKPENVPAGCNDFEVLVARGTGEPDFAPSGSFGVVVGDPVISNLTRILPNARGYPVQYPASASLLSPRRGSSDVVARLRRQSAACPNQKFALVGYSQGAVVMRSAVTSLSTTIQNEIVAVVSFGDPAERQGRGEDWPGVLRNRNLQICATEGGGDPVCNAQGTCIFFHLIYVRQEFIDRAVSFLSAAFRGQPLPQ